MSSLKLIILDSAIEGVCYHPNNRFGKKQMEMYGGQGCEFSPLACSQP